MAAARNLRHIVVPGEPRSEPYRSWAQRRLSKLPQTPDDIRAFAAGLVSQIGAARTAATERQAAAEADGLPRTGDAIYLEFSSFEGFELALPSLENASRGIEIVTVTPVARVEGDVRPQRAVVVVPDDQIRYFIDKIEAYADEQTKTGKPKNQQLVQRIAAVRLATLRKLWTDADDAYPAQDEPIWWEVWLRRRDDREVERFSAFAAHRGIVRGGRLLRFEDRAVLLARASASQLAASIDVLADVAELRRAKDSPSFFVELPAAEQAAWVKDLVGRIDPPQADAPVVCLLDTGVTQGHPLIAPGLDPADLHACDPAWGTHDHHRHGTEMAGLALLGDLTAPLAGVDRVPLRHGLESVKVLPPPAMGANAPELYGTLTAQAVSLVEIQTPERRRCYLMAVTTPDSRDRGVPTSWSAAVDALAAGRSFDATTEGLVYLDDQGEAAAARLFVVSAGNVRVEDFRAEHMDVSDLEVVHDPAHAWNALTVGAMTDKAALDDDDYDGWEAVAPAGGLSPYSSTSIGFDSRWPIKPDVVFEGGNVAHDRAGHFQAGCPSLSVLSTWYRPQEQLVTASWATSAAAAEVARLVARIQGTYPDLWPETARALIVHSARWTRQMRKAPPDITPARAKQVLLRRHGFGVPRDERALYSARDALTLVRQGVIRPFEKGKLREMHVHSLPWPSDVLRELGEAAVTLRVTLSYFVEPNPSRRGWVKRHSYASHGLRFDVKGPLESAGAFRLRINKAARDEEEDRPTARDAGSTDWFLGHPLRHRGSLHSDTWSGTAAQLADRDQVAVYPVTGWWKDQQRRDRSARGVRYALVVSIETHDVEVDIWTPVANMVGIEIET